MCHCSDTSLKNKQYKSKILAAIRETAEDLHEAQVMPTETLHDFDALCLTPVQEQLDAPKPLSETRSGTITP